MPDGPKSPSRPTVKRLFALSGNRCAFLGCTTPLVDRDTGTVVGEVCHIKGEKPAAPRFDNSQDNKSRHSFDNLILLCNIHHKVIDDNEHEYTVDHLLKMKEQHETRLVDKEPIDDSTSEAFTSSILNSFGDQNEVIQAINVSGGQVAHTIINNPISTSEPDDVQIEGRARISGDTATVGCPYLTLTVICRSKRPAKIRKAVLSLTDHGIIAALEAGFDENLNYEPLPGSAEELSVELFPMQKPNTPEGFVLERDDTARFLLPALAAPLGLFMLRSPSAMSLKVEFFDESRQLVVDGETLKGHLDGLINITKQTKCEPNFPTVTMSVSVMSLTPPGAGPVGKVNPNPIDWLRLGTPNESRKEQRTEEAMRDIPWFQRKSNLVVYPGLLQGPLPLCVYSAIAGAVNYLMDREVWTAIDLKLEHDKTGKPTDFGVADTALDRVSGKIAKYQHNTGLSSQELTPSLIREWIADDGVVILSMELRNDEVSHRSGWHMFTLMAEDGKHFQVWDTNGLDGYFTEEEITNGFYYPNGWYFMPHDKEDTLVLKRNK